MGLRYVLQLMAMFSDVVFWLMFGILVLFICENISNLIVFSILVFIGFRAFKSWKVYGFISWKRDNIKKFLVNARKAGL